MEGTGTFRMGGNDNELFQQDRVWFENPVSEEITISSIDEMVHIRITDVSGKTIYNSDKTSDYQSIDINNLPAGLYNLLVVHKDGFTTYKQLIKP